MEEDDDDVVRDCGPKGEGEGQMELGAVGDSGRSSSSCGGVPDVGARRTLIPCMFSATISPAAASSRLLWVLDLRVHRRQLRPTLLWFQNRTASPLILLNNVYM